MRPLFMFWINVFHMLVPNTNCGPAAFFESRMSTHWCARATSTQWPSLMLLELLRQARLPGWDGASPSAPSGNLSMR